MNIIKKLSLLTALVAVMFAFNACEEDTVTPTVDTPSAPIGLEATSINSTTVHIRWKDASDIDKTMLKDYTVTYYPSNTSATDAPMLSATESGVAFPIPDLDSTKEYTFEVVTNYDNGESSSKSTIKWAPAMRFTQVAANTIKLYASNVSGQGSGLKLAEYDDTFNEYSPKILFVGEIADWNLGLNTKDSKVKFGSASLLDYVGASTATQSADVSIAVPATSLNDVFDSQKLDNKNFSQDVHDLTNTTSSVVVYVRTTENDGVHYAKVFLKNVNGSFLQGAAGSQYVEIQISYQVNAGFPYAKK